MLFHLRMPPPGGIAESRRDKGLLGKRVSLSYQYAYHSCHFERSEKS